MKLLTVFILFIAMFCGGFSNDMSENEKFIQGKWHLAGTIDDDRKMAWFLKWEFADGEFKQTGYPPITQTGKYKVIEEKDDTLKLKLYRQKGTFGEDDSEIEIEINKKNKTLKISGKEGFKRVREEKNS